MVKIHEYFQQLFVCFPASLLRPCLVSGCHPQPHSLQMITHFKCKKCLYYAGRVTTDVKQPQTLTYYYNQGLVYKNGKNADSYL